jgi:hypothetical protein
MHARRQRMRRGRRLTRGWRLMAIGLTGTVCASLSQCLPSDYFYNFAAAGRTELLNAFADSVFTTVTDALFPVPPDDGEANTGA